MQRNTSCNLASLEVYKPTPENPWDVNKINHLYRRIGFGASKTIVKAALLQNNPSALVDTLIDDAINLNPTPAPSWGFWNRDNFKNAPEKVGYYRNEEKKQMIKDMIQNNVRDRLTLFWSNHFVTEDDIIISPAYQFQYYNLLQYNAIGNFKEFVKDIGVSSPMLVYLNGDENIKDRPNENYARELYELFTLGVDNGYTENDIQETAKALTGWVEKNKIEWGTLTFNPSKFSNESKTIFGQTGNWGYDDVIRILIEQRGSLVANFICTKLYTYFVSPTINQDIISQMAQTFTANDYEIAPVLRQLFKSEHFFDKESIGSIIKSPSDLLLCFYNETGFDLPASVDHIDFFKNSLRVLGQELFNPPDVKGWLGDEEWISPDVLIGRWESIRYIIVQAKNQNLDQFKNFILGLPIGQTGQGNLELTTNDVDKVVRTITNYFFSRGIQDPVIYNEALGVFKGDSIPENYYQDGIWNLGYTEVSNQFLALLDYIAEIPEFQLK